MPEAVDVATLLASGFTRRLIYLRFKRAFVRIINQAARASDQMLLGIPAYLDAPKEDDIPELAKAACWEADSNYPVPRRMTQEDCEALLRAVLPPKKSAAKRATRKPAARGTTTAKKAAMTRPKPRSKARVAGRK